MTTMNSQRKPILLDLETRSPVDLRSEGGRRYAAHPGTEILCASWYDTETGEESVWIANVTTEALKGAQGLLNTHFPGAVKVYGGSVVPEALVKLAQSGRPFVAHNAWGFDSLVWEKRTPPEAHPKEWIDSSPLARAVGLPGALEAIGRELRGEGKHKEGRARLKKFMGMKFEPKLGDRIMIAAYCHDDTCGLLKVLWEYLEKRPLHPFEREVMETDRAMNGEGVRVDLELAYALKDFLNAAEAEALARCQEISGGESSPFKTVESLRKRDLVFQWIARVGGQVGLSLRKQIIEQLVSEVEAYVSEDDEHEVPEFASEAVGDDVRVPSIVLDFLIARSAVLRVAKGKVNAVINSHIGGRLYDLLVYYGAHTGRWAGRRFQVQNLPGYNPKVPVWKLFELFEKERSLPLDRVKEILAGASPEDPASLDDAGSAMLRGLLLPDEGHLFAPGDYNAIEARMVAWLTNETTLLRMFRENQSPYNAMATKIYGRPPVDKKDPIRQVGKVVVLGATYQMGADAFLAYAAAMGVNLEAAGTTAKACISAFRDMFPAIAGSRTGDMMDNGDPIRQGGAWRMLEQAALNATEGGYGRYKRIIFRKVGTDLLMNLPSGRPIYYRDAVIEDVTPWWELGKDRPKTKPSVVYRSPRGFRNALYGGKLLENGSQAASRDLLASAIVQSWKNGIKVRMSVHDELVPSVADESVGRLAASIMSRPPEWAKDFPLLVEADLMPRYSKVAPKGSPKFDYQNGEPFNG